MFGELAGIISKHIGETEKNVLKSFGDKSINKPASFFELIDVFRKEAARRITRMTASTLGSAMEKN